jgi:hypothetical protein
LHYIIVLDIISLNKNKKIKKQFLKHLILKFLKFFILFSEISLSFFFGVSPQSGRLDGSHRMAPPSNPII